MTLASQSVMAIDSKKKNLCTVVQGFCFLMIAKVDNGFKRR